jgi:hypothetical protein
LAGKIRLNVFQEWDQRMRTSWGIANAHGKVQLWDVINFLPDDRKSFVMKRFGISEDGETISPTTITELARQTSTSRQNIDKNLGRIKTHVDTLLSLVRRGGDIDNAEFKSFVTSELIKPIICVSCQFENTSDASFCGGCGRNLNDIICSFCKFDNSNTSSFCQRMSCGKALS